MGVHDIAGGMDTSRVAPTDAERRQDAQEAALRYLTRTGNNQPEVVGALGLDQIGEPVGRRCGNPECGKPFLASRLRQKFCTAACALDARKAANAGEAA